MTKSRAPNRRPLGKLLASTVLALSVWSGPGYAQGAGFSPILPDFSGVVKDEDWAKILGKALFWDEKLGSDGMACASCHFSAGADPRLANQLSPGLLQVTLDGDGNQIGATDGTFGNADGLMPSGHPAGPNYTVQPDDFPFHQLADEADRNSDIVTTTNDRMASAGSFDAEFKRAGRKHDRCGKADDSVFHVNGRAARTVEPRNTPTMINAVFNFRNFWDGRAKEIFNGKGVFGRSETANDPTARVIEWDGYTASLMPFELDHASLASQAVGPPLSNLEMSCDNRTFADVGNKMLNKVRRPLSSQRVHADDSLFGYNGPKGNVIHRRGKGLKYTYEQLVKKAFHEKYWSAAGKFVIESDGTLVHQGHGGFGGLFGQLSDLSSLFGGIPFAEAAFDESGALDHLFGDGKLGEYLSGHGRGHHKGDGFSQMEQNFSLFFGLAVMLYESELISDQSKFDEANAKGCFPSPLPGPPTRLTVPASCVADGTLTQAEADGFELFSNFGPRSGGCVACHNGPLFSDATAFRAADGVTDPLATAPLIQQFGVPAFHDAGFHNIGTRPVHQDLGNGATDPWGEPLSIARQVKRERQTGVAPVDGISVPDLCLIPGSPTPFCTGPSEPEADDLRLVVDGGMKTPSLRNVALTPPYFHYGGYSNLEQVVEFYARGGSRRDLPGGDDSGTGPTGDGGATEAGTHPSGAFGTNAFIGRLQLDIDLFQDRDGNIISDGPKTQEDGIKAIAAFMRTMTDERVRCDAAPFDHPSLKVPNGHKPNGRDKILKIPAVGSSGAAGTAYGCLSNDGDLFAIQGRYDR